MSIKVLAERILQGNQLGNRTETKSFLIPKQGKPESFQASLPTEGNRETSPADLQRMVGEVLAEVDRLGRPWPANFFTALSEEDRDQLQGLVKLIDQAAIDQDYEGLTTRLTKWRELLLSGRTVH